MENRENTLLITDDSPYNIELLTEIFQEHYRIFTAENGQEALDVMRNNIGEIDAVLLDINMPVKDGYQVLMDMNMDEKLKYLPVIVITADDDIESEYKAFDYGAYDFITRPFNFKTLKQRVDSMFNQLDIEKIRLENERLIKEAQTEKRMSAVADNLPCGVAVIETDGITAECTYYNSMALELFHMSSDEFFKLFEKNSETDKYADWLSALINASTKEKKIDFYFLHTIQSEHISRWIQLLASCDEIKDDKKVLYCVFIAADE